MRTSVHTYFCLSVLLFIHQHGPLMLDKVLFLLAWTPQVIQGHPEASLRLTDGSLGFQEASLCPPDASIGLPEASSGLPKAQGESVRTYRDP